MNIKRSVCVWAVGLALAGCAAPPQVQRQASPCDEGEATYACQVQRYHDISVQ